MAPLTTKPPPDAERPGRHTRTTTKSVEQTSTDEADHTSAPLTFGRHSRFACCLRSFRVEPCSRCCRCVDDCGHPEFAKVLVEATL